MRRLALAGIVLTAACVAPAAARVERIEILSRQPFAAGAEFGPAGAYEKLRGRAFFALDPNAAANAPIADLKLAPRNERGLVEFSADFLMLRPVDAARRNGTLLYEVNNRGNIAILRQLNEASPSNDPTSTADAGNGFLFRQGFTLRVVGMGGRCRGDAGRQSPGPAGADRHEGRRADHRQGRLRADRESAHRAGPFHRDFRHRLSAGERRRAGCGAHRARPAGRRAPADPAYRLVVRASRARVRSRPRSGSTAASSPGASISSPTRRAIRS